MGTTIDTRFFRAGVGTVIYNSDGKVALFERTQNPIGLWQFQQGGIDLGEHPEDTLWRELLEEVGLTKEDFSAVDEYPFWTTYQPDDTLDAPQKSRIGHTHRWYFLYLKDGIEIDLHRATMQEASNYKWLYFDKVLLETEQCKLHAYRDLAKYFQTNILK